MANLTANNQVGDGPNTSDAALGSTSAGGNWCTLNPLDTGENGSWNGELQNGNLKLSGSAGVVKSRASFALDTTNGSYWEVRWGSATDANCGISKLTQKNLTTSSQIGADPAYDETGYKGSTGVIDTDGSTEATYATSAEGTIVAFAYKAGRLYVGKVASASAAPTWFNSGNPANGTGYVNSSVKTDPDYWAAACGLSHTVNFGQDSSFGGEETAQANTDANNVGEFWGSVPTGYLALCNSNLPDPSIKLPGENFNTVLYTGNGGNDYAITGVGFQPDFVWNKDRASNYHGLWDVVRGVDSRIYSNNTDAANTGTDAFESFDSDGFSLNSNSTWNANTNSYVSWNWKAGGAPTADNDNTTGAMDANSVSLNGSLQAAYTPSGSPTIYPTRMSIDTTTGFSIVSYSGNSVAGATIPHGLSQAPNMVMFKRLTYTGNWIVGSDALTSWDYYLDLAEVTAQADFDFFNDTAPTASVISISAAGAINYDNTISANGTYIAYCFHSVEGYSKVGSYTGNGNADGPFVYLGFRPAWIMIKRVDASSPTGWTILDDKRVGYNVANAELFANTKGAEEANNRNDLVSNGYKGRATSGNVNTDGSTYQYYAVAASPFKYANAR